MKRLIPLLVVAALAAGAWFAYRHYRAPDDRMILSGSIEARTVEVGSLLGGRVSAVAAAEGQTVRRGQTLVTFEPDLTDLSIAEQKALIAQSRAALGRARAGLRVEEKKQAEIEWRAAEVDRKRFQSLWQQGVIGKRDYDATEVRAANAREALRAAERGGRPEDIASAAAAVTQQEQRLAFLERQRRELEVTAPVDGRIESIDLRPGDLVGANQPVATLLEPDQLWVRVYVPEPKLGYVEVGQQVRVSVDSFPGRTFAGKVVEIRHQAEYTPRNVQTIDQRTDQVFGVKVAIAPDPALKAGMAALITLPLPEAAAPAGRS
jgi:HlyD family secretion protein